MYTKYLCVCTYIYTYVPHSIALLTSVLFARMFVCAYSAFVCVI